MKKLKFALAIAALLILGCSTIETVPSHIRHLVVLDEDPPTNILDVIAAVGSNMGYQVCAADRWNNCYPLQSGFSVLDINKHADHIRLVKRRKAIMGVPILGSGKFPNIEVRPEGRKLYVTGYTDGLTGSRADRAKKITEFTNEFKVAIKRALAQ